MLPQTKVARVMHEFKEGTLTSHGKPVTDRTQALAIALNTAGISRKMETGGQILFKDKFIVPAKQPDVKIVGEVVTRDSPTSKFTQPITIKGYLYKSENFFLSKRYKVLFYQDYKGILYSESFKTYEQAQKDFRDKTKHYHAELNKAEKHEPSEIIIDKFKRGGTTGGRGMSDLPDNYFVYKWHEERGHLTMHVENKDNNYLWEYDNEDEGSSPVDDGFMENLDDTDGLEKYLIDLKILPKNAVLIDSETAIQKYEHYAHGGIISSAISFLNKKITLNDFKF